MGKENSTHEPTIHANKLTTTSILYECEFDSAIEALKPIWINIMCWWWDSTPLGYHPKDYDCHEESYFYL